MGWFLTDRQGSERSLCWRGGTAVLILLFASVFLGGCTPPPPPTAQTMTMTCKQPTLSALPQTKEFQEKGGLQISVAPASYVCRETSQVSKREVPDPTRRATGGLVPGMRPSGTRQDARYIETTETPSVQVAPDRLEFIVKVNNKLPRVFRGAGIVVQFNVAGKLQAVEQQGYAALTSSIILLYRTLLLSRFETSS